MQLTEKNKLPAFAFDRRLLLMPKCLRVEDKCPAPFDDFGLLCKQCGLCTIQEMQAEAERLGYAVLVAEGSAAPNTDAAIAKYQAAEDVLARDLPVLPLRFGQNVFGHSTKVKNVFMDLFNRVDLKAPMVIRLDGTNAEQGRAILQEHASDRLVSKPTMVEAAKAAVELAAKQ